MTHRNTQYQQSGIALLMTIMVLSVVISVTLAVVELSLKQLALSVDTRDSEIAFHAANAGLECARYTRRYASSSFENNNAVTMNCFGNSSTMTRLSSPSVEVRGGTGPGLVREYTKSISWGINHCSEMDIIVLVVPTTSASAAILTGPSNRNLNTVIPSYPAATKSCEIGGVCTIISVSGYNTTCSNFLDRGVLKRQVLLEF